MKKLVSLLLALCFFMMNFSPVLAATTSKKHKTTKKVVKNKQVSKAAKPVSGMRIAFVFDGPSEKNKQVLETFKSEIVSSSKGDYTPIFDSSLVYVGDWTKQGAINATNKALNSSARMVISLGYMSSIYLDNKKDKNKLTITIDDYGLKGFESTTFNPVQQSVNDFVLFKRLVPLQNKTAVLINESFYKTRSDWDKLIAQKFKEKNLDLKIVFIPINQQNYMQKLENLPNDVDSVFITPLFNLTDSQRKTMFDKLNSKKMPTFSTVGEEDVELGVLLGTSTANADKKLAEATSFSIHGILHGAKVKDEKITYIEDKIIFVNTDTAEAIGYIPPLRLLNNAQIITKKEKPVYDLSYVFNTLDEHNKDIEREKYLVRAARRSATSAVLRYLPTLRIDLGYQKYNDEYAYSYTDVPTHVGKFAIGLDQVIYSPDLVTNIIVKNKKLKFQHAQEILTQQNVGLEVAMLYVDVLTLQNAIAIQEEIVKDTRENLAIARVREKQGFSGKEEILRWAGELSDCEQKLLNMKADYKNLQIAINTMLYQDQKIDFNLKPLKADDPAFYTSDMHVIDHVRNSQKLNTFIDKLVEYALDVAPETVKLKAAIAMKKAEMSNYAQKFVLPDAKITLEYGSQFDRNLPYETAGKYSLYQARMLSQTGFNYGQLATTSGRMFIGAQWKPIEGGHKVAEIARCKAELDELKAHLDQVNFEIETNVRQVVNRAIAKYFTIEKDYKAMFAQGENYKIVKAKYAAGKVNITQVVDAQEAYLSAKLAAINSQYEFFKELLWVQRGLACVNWTKASPKAKKWVEDLKVLLPAEDDFSLEKL